MSNCRNINGDGKQEEGTREEDGTSLGEMQRTTEGEK